MQQHLSAEQRWGFTTVRYWTATSCLSAVILVLITTMLQYSRLFACMFSSINVIHYSTLDGNFTTFECQVKGRTYRSVIRQYQQYQKDHPDRDCTLYRCFSQNWFQIWSWGDYLTHPRWDLPYLDEQCTSECDRNLKGHCPPCAKTP